jgi:5'-methylthioadenosine phosphorylase
VSRLALVAGGSLEGLGLPDGDWVVLDRHSRATGYVLPHRIDHQANMRRLQEKGCDRVLAIASVGSLRAEAGPGSLIAPHDFIALGQGASRFDDASAHVVPAFDAEWRERVVRTWGEVGLSTPRDGGVYWQMLGPRLETPAEIALIAPHADVVGMTTGSECLAACEHGLRYAAVCVVDNLASGIAERPLTLAEIEVHRAEHGAALRETLTALLPVLAEAPADG